MSRFAHMRQVRKKPLINTVAAAVHSGTEQAKAGVSQQEESQGRSGESYLAAQAGKVSGSAF